MKDKIDDWEFEVKLYLNNISALHSRVKSLKAQLVQPRLYETNYRFDTPAGDFARQHRVLRLRQDSQAILTYKSPSQEDQEVIVRKEYEVQVSDFRSARLILESLGYQVSAIYEKYRTTYLAKDVQITLDELPYGNFTEIEGPDPSSIFAMAQQLNLDWSTRITDSYLGLFQKLKNRLNLEFRDLSFKNFAGMKITSEDLGVHPADS